jgi:predicted deacylase
MPPSPACERVVMGRSVQGREIAMYLFRGNGPSVLVIGGIHGNEQTSVDVARGLLELLRQRPELTQGRTVAIIPNTNPDGYAINSRFNAHKIDLNRNFPAKNFKSQRGPTTTRGAGAGAGGRGGGVTPLSEPESRIIYDAIERLQPRLLISVHSIDRGRECNNYDGPAETIARIMSQHNGYRVTDTIGYPTPGSLGSYAGIDRQIPMITLELPRPLDGAPAWEQNRDALLAAIEKAGAMKSEIRMSKSEINPNDGKKK